VDVTIVNLLVVLSEGFKKIIDCCCRKRRKVRKHSLEMIVKNNMKLQCGMANGRIVTRTMLLL